MMREIHPTRTGQAPCTLALRALRVEVTERVTIVIAWSVMWVSPVSLPLCNRHWYAQLCSATEWWIFPVTQ